MKATVIKNPGNPKEWAIEINQGVQYFRLDYYTRIKSEAAWMARMFQTALRNHDKERRTKSGK